MLAQYRLGRKNKVQSRIEKKKSDPAWSESAEKSKSWARCEPLITISEFITLCFYLKHICLFIYFTISFIDCGENVTDAKIKLYVYVITHIIIIIKYNKIYLKEINIFIFRDKDNQKTSDIYYKPVETNYNRQARNNRSP